MPHELRIHRLIERLEKQKAIHLKNMQAHKKQAEFSKQSAEACLISICSLDIELLDVKTLLENEENK